MIRRWVIGWLVIRRAYWSWRELLLDWKSEDTIAFYKECFWDELNGDFFPPIKFGVEFFNSVR